MGEEKTINDLKNDYPEKIQEVEEALDSYSSEDILNLLKREFPKKWKYLSKKLAYPYE